MVRGGCRTSCSRSRHPGKRSLLRRLILYRYHIPSTGQSMSLQLHASQARKCYLLIAYVAPHDLRLTLRYLLIKMKCKIIQIKTQSKSSEHSQRKRRKRRSRIKTCAVTFLHNPATTTSQRNIPKQSLRFINARQRQDPAKRFPVDCSILKHGNVSLHPQPFIPERSPIIVRQS